MTHHPAMKNPVFMVPRVLGYSHLLDVHPSSAVGITNTALWPAGADDVSVGTLLRQWTGLLRGITLAGYRTVELFIEASPATASERLLLDMATLGLGKTDMVPDELDVARSTGAPLMVALTLDPLWPFGEEAGAPLAIDLPLDAIGVIDGVFAPVHQSGRGWLAFTCDDADFRAAQGSLRTRGLEIAGLLADAVADSWLRQPHALGPPAGLGWVFESRNWWFPPLAPDRPDSDARLLAAGLEPVSRALATQDLGIVEFLTTQIVRQHDPHTFRQEGGFGQMTRAWAGQRPDALTGAYRRRLDSLGPRSEIVERTAENIDNRFMWVDALLTLVEQGAIGVLHRLLPGHPSTAQAELEVGATIPEWTTPILTGQWDAVHSMDTILLNQAGTRVAGYWQQRNSGALNRYILDGSMTAGDRDGGPLEFTVSVWPKPNRDIWLNHEAELGVPLAVGTLAAGQQPGAVPELSFSVDLGGGATTREFVKSPRGTHPHHTPWTLNGLPEPLKAQFRSLRDAPLHYDETAAVARLIELVVHYVNRFLEEEPGWQELTLMMEEFTATVRHELSGFYAYEDLMATARFLVKAVLSEVRPAGGDSYWSLLMLMFRLTFQTTLLLQDLFDLRVLPDPSARFRYRWRLIDIRMIGGGLLVTRADGTGTFEIQRVDDAGVPMGPVVSRTIDLVDFQAGIVGGPWPEFGPDDMKEWNYLFPTDRDILPHLDGATFSLVSSGASWLVVDSSSLVEVALAPTDDLPPVWGRIEADLVKFADLDPTADGLDPDDAASRVKRAKDLVDDGKDLLRKGLKDAKALKPEFRFVRTEGWIRTEAGGTTRPVAPPVPADDYVSSSAPWARFATDEYALTPEFRDRIREFLLWNLPLLSGTNEMIVEGNASRIGPDPYNVRLSRDRAVSVLTAVYDILGPQFAIPCGSVRIRGLGSSQSTGDPDSDLELDRRVDVVLNGQVRLRS